jgi:hypothetical protein
MAINWSALEDAIYDWAAQVSGLTTRWADQKIPQPQGDYLLLQHTAGPIPLGSFDARDEVYVAEDDEIEHRVQGQRELVVTFQVFTAVTTGASQARAILGKLQTSLNKPSILATLAGKELVVVNIGDVQVLNAIEEADFEGRATMDVRFRTCDVEVDPTTYIETHETSGTYS